MRFFSNHKKYPQAINTFDLVCCIVLAFKSGDQTERIFTDAKNGAHAALKEKAPRLTALEKGMQKLMHRGGHPVRHQRSIG